VLTGKHIVLDAGHGGFDGGATGVEGQIEAELNLQVTQQLADLFAQAGAQVTCTRTDEHALAEDKNEDMRVRASIIREAQPDVCLSIHMNKFSQASSCGAQTFYQTASAEGEQLASMIQSAIVENLQPQNHRVHKAADLYVLKAGSAPATLVECGFLSNPEEARKLEDPQYQAQLAWCIYRGVLEYLLYSDV